MKLRVASLVLAVSSVCLMAGCTSKSISKNYDNNEDVKPYLQPYSDAYLIMVGAIVETKMVAKSSPGAVEFTFLSNETVIDREKYAYTEKEFAYVGDGGQEFVPGIPLLKYPLEIGQEWDWSGVYRLGNRDRKSTAKVRTEEETLSTVVGQFPTIKTSIDLTIETDTMSPAVHTFVFWIAPNKGIIKRDFLYSGSREPMKATTASEDQ